LQGPFGATEMDSHFQTQAVIGAGEIVSCRFEGKSGGMQLLAKLGIQPTEFRGIELFNGLVKGAFGSRVGLRRR
jgi:hypothetical protein